MKNLSRIFRQLGLTSARNKKKKFGVLFVSPNRTFYMTFVLSMLFHAGLIYSIPAVDIFSESPGGASVEPIVVDLLQDDSPESLSEIPSVDENQFQAPAPETSDISEVPPIESESETILPEPEFEDNDIKMTLPIVEENGDPTENYLLLSQTSFRDPQIESSRKRSLEKLPVQQRRPFEQAQGEKLTANHIKTTPFPLHRPTETDELTQVKIVPFHRQQTQPPERSEQGLDFPLYAQQHQSQQTENPLPSESQLQFGKRRMIEGENEHSTLTSISDIESLASPKRRFGIPKNDETDKNRFGIFAGRTYEELKIKESLQKATFEREHEEAAPLLPEEMQKAAQKLAPEMKIEGPVKGRKIIRRPAPPKVDIKIGVDLRLKFWVLPDGTIGEVIPLKRGDAQLERVAIAYLKQWLFEPLPSGLAQQKKIWGTIPIRFIVR